MLIDINANIGHWPFQQLRYNTCNSLLQRMNEFGIDQSVISNLNGIFYKNTQSANEELFEEINSSRKFKNRFYPFGIINPIYAGWKNDLETCAGKMGMKGIRLYPAYHDYAVTDAACIELVKRARDKGLIVAFTMRMVDSRERSWMDIDYVAGTAKPEWNLKNFLPIIKEVPDAKYMILNFANNPALTEDEMALIAKTNVLFDTSGRSITSMDAFIKKFGIKKFAFGTHAPILDCLTGLLRIESLKETEADEAAKEILRSGNARIMLNIQD